MMMTLSLPDRRLGTVVGHLIGTGIANAGKAPQWQARTTMALGMRAAATWPTELDSMDPSTPVMKIRGRLASILGTCSARSLCHRSIIHTLSDHLAALTEVVVAGLAHIHILVMESSLGKSVMKGNFKNHLHSHQATHGWVRTLVFHNLKTAIILISFTAAPSVTTRSTHPTVAGMSDRTTVLQAEDAMEDLAGDLSVAATVVAVEGSNKTPATMVRDAFLYPHSATHKVVTSLTEVSVAPHTFVIDKTIGLAVGVDMEKGKTLVVNQPIILSNPIQPPLCLKNGVDLIIRCVVDQHLNYSNYLAARLHPLKTVVTLNKKQA
jgi:hypothetical protein